MCTGLTGFFSCSDLHVLCGKSRVDRGEMGEQEEERSRAALRRETRRRKMKEAGKNTALFEKTLLWPLAACLVLDVTPPLERVQFGGLATLPSGESKRGREMKKA